MGGMDSYYQLLRDQAANTFNTNKGYWDDYKATETTNIADVLSKGLARYNTLETDRTAQLNTQEADMMARLADIESARRNEGALMRAAQQRQMQGSIGDLASRQASNAQALQARGIDVSRLGGSNAEAMAMLQSQQASQRDLGDRLARAESVAAEDRRLSGASGFDDAEALLAAHLYAGRTGLEDTAATSTSDLNRLIMGKMQEIISQRDSRYDQINAAETENRIKQQQAAAAAAQRKAANAEADQLQANAIVSIITSRGGSVTPEAALAAVQGGLGDTLLSLAINDQASAQSLLDEEQANVEARAQFLTNVENLGLTEQIPNAEELWDNDPDIAEMILSVEFTKSQEEPEIPSPPFTVPSEVLNNEQYGYLFEDVETVEDFELAAQDVANLEAVSGLIEPEEEELLITRPILDENGNKIFPVGTPVDKVLSYYQIDQTVEELDSWDWGPVPIQ